LRYSKIKKELSIRAARKSLRCSTKAPKLTEYIPANGSGTWISYWICHGSIFKI